MSEISSPTPQPSLAVDNTTIANSPAETRPVTPAKPANEGGSAGRRAAANTQAVIDKTVDRLAEGVGVFEEKAQQVANRAVGGAQKVSRHVDPFVTQRPYASLGIGVAFGLVLGLMVAPRPRIIYVKPRD